VFVEGGRSECWTFMSILRAFVRGVDELQVDLEVFILFSLEEVMFSVFLVA
jgi:hypothetical protein